jgi:hypothetical protein
MTSEHFPGHCQSKFYTACSRTTAGQSSAVFAHELSPRSVGFDAENRLYLFALTVPKGQLAAQYLSECLGLSLAET